ncbi:tRNA (mnm(5)s(2)U34)-methyltransferase [Thiohalorhabdus sp.]|uniref:tRNA (mnm(5)s(2)U34)-methyltransferase n=1 Tax=Thiohalorhabdus sp. TaxID=3094134 RepID=UPI002FC3DF7C
MPAPQVAAAQRTLTAVLRPGDLALDATAGNGHDTAFLAQRVGPSGRVLAVDVQAEAVAAAAQRLRADGLADRVDLRRADHADLAELAPASRRGRFRAAVFNLGYLPGQEGDRITRPATTLGALDATFRLLGPGGRLAVVAYPGHAGGEEEAEAVASWARSAAEAGHRVLAVGRWRRGLSPRAPRLSVIERIIRPDGPPEGTGEGCGDTEPGGTAQKREG